MQPEQKPDETPQWTDNDWTAEDDAITDRIWDELAQERKAEEPID